MNILEGLTARQQEIMNFLYDYVEEHGRFPTIRTVVKQFGFCGTNAVTGHFRLLINKGCILQEGFKGCKARYSLPVGNPEIVVIDKVPYLRIPGRFKVRLTKEMSQSLTKALQAVKWS